MKYISILLILHWFSCERVFADAGNCVKYEVEIHLKNGQKVSGFVVVGGYEKRFQFANESFLNYLKIKNPSDTVEVFKIITRLPFPITKIGREKCEFRFCATPPEQLIKVLKVNIQTVKVLSYSVCNYCDPVDEENGYTWNGISPIVIKELSQAEIDLLQTKPVAVINFGLGLPDHTDGYWMISYSANYSMTELEKTKQQYLAEAKNLLNLKQWRVLQSKYKDWKQTLREKKVIIFRVTFEI